MPRYRTCFAFPFACVPGALIAAVLVASLFQAASLPAAEQVMITEFMARNTHTLADEDGAFPDWVELHNTETHAVNLDGWFLTDATNNLTKWRLPATNLAANAYLIIFASGKDRAVPGAPLHASFQLGGDGEYLALVRPDLSIATEFAPSFPGQFDDLSYGDGQTVATSTLLASGAGAKFLVPPDGSLGTNWAYPAFDDSAWSNAVTGLGFSSGSASNLGLYSYWPIREGTGTTVSNLVAGRTHGTISGATWVANDPTRGTVLNFNGTSSYVSAGSIPRLGQTTSNFTWSFWFRQTAVNNANAVVLGNRSGGVQSPLQFVKITPSNFEYYRDANIGFIAYAIPNGQWLHLAVVKNGSSLRYFSNGAQVGTSTAGGDIESNPFFMGGDPGAAGENANGLIDDVSLWTSALSSNQLTQLAAGTSPLQLSGFGALVGTDVDGAMRNVSSTVYARVPFVVPAGSTFDTLKLRVKYDDGFVAYLNGVEVARRQAPASPAYDSAATAARPDASAVIFEDIDLTTFLDVLEEGANVLALHGLNVSAGDGDFLLLPELEASSLTGVGARYFSFPTPGTVNNLGFAGYVADTKFSHDRGFYDTNFSVSITCATPGATIRFTTNGVAPNETNGVIYSAPIPIGRTTVLRAAAFKPGYQPSAPDAQTYIFLRDVFLQDGTGYPTYPANDWRLDARVVTNAAYRADITNDMKSLPVVSLSLDPQQFWGPQGIYTLATSQGVNYERACSAEMFFPDGSRNGFQVNCGLRIAGGASRSTLTPKHGLRLLFKSVYGASKLNYRFFDNTEVERFDSLAFRPNFNMSWVRTDNSGPLLNGNADGAERSHALYVRDQWTKHSYTAMGAVGAHERFVHLYVNGVYWGLYNPCERTDGSFAAAYFGGEKEEYDAIFSDLSATARPVDGDKNTWNTALAVANAGLTTPAQYALIQKYVDVTNLADYMMLNFYCATVDWPWQNWNALRKRETNAQFKFIVWDAEYTLDTLPWMPDDRTPNVGAGSGGVNGNDLDSPARFFFHLRQNSEWRLLFADRARRHFFNNGALTTNQTIPRFLAQCDEIDRAIVCESARWGDVVRTANPYTRNVEWLTEKNRLLTQFFPQRTTNVLQHFRNASLYPLVAAPDFNLHGATFSNQFIVQIAAPLGVIYFTTNGTDPRLPGGAVAPGAMVYGGPFPLTSSRLLRVRAFYTNTWSALTEAPFIETTPPPLRITEIMFNPGPAPGLTNGAEEFEYLELKNIGAMALPLGGMRFTAGIDFTFPSQLLAPGDTVLVVKNRAAFEARYGAGKNIAGEWLGFLSDDGERLRLEGALGETIQDFSYSDWYPLTDGLGFSLVVIDANGPLDRWGERESWRAGYSPDADEPAPAFPRVVITAALTHSVPPAVDSIEVSNLEGTNVNVGGWFLTDDASVPKKYRIPDGTMILAGSSLVFTETNFNAMPGDPASFALSSSGDAVYLYSGDANTNLTGYSHGFPFGAAPGGVPFVRYVNSYGEESFVLDLPVGPIVINEIMYHAPGGADEFVELTNITPDPVLLYDPAHATNTWKLAGLDFQFPPGVTVPPFGFVLLVNSDPNAFRARYGVPAAVQVFRFVGNLQDDGETLEVQRPDVPEGSDVNYYAAETVRYNDRAPWPKAADGGGASLQRTNTQVVGNDAAYWIAAAPSPGRALPGISGVSFFTAGPSHQVVLAGTTATFTVQLQPSRPPLGLQWYFQNQPIAGATNAVLTLPSVQPEQAGPYCVIAFDELGAQSSPVANLGVRMPATITRQPASLTVFPLTNVVFDVLAASGSPINYQWQRNGLNLVLATNNSYAIPSVTPAHQGTYVVLVTDAAGTISSAPALLTVVAHPVFTLQPTNRSVIAPTNGTNISLVGAATSSTPVRYQWLWFGTNLPGATNASLNLSNATVSANGPYQVVATDNYGSVASSNALLTILNRPVITLQPVSVEVPAGRSATFTVTAVGSEPLGFRWRQGGLTFTNGIVLTAPGASSLTLTNVKPADSNTYNVVITNSASTVSSANAILTVLTDTDGDGLPDAWEQGRPGFSAVDPSDAARDDDQDGLSNLAEYLAGTDYLDANSYLRVDLTVSGEAFVTFQALSNRTYTVQFSDTVSPFSWLKLGDVPARTNNRVEVLRDTAASPQRFYRLATPIQR